jgi:hypothetical protein
MNINATDRRMENLQTTVPEHGACRAEDESFGGIRRLGGIEAGLVSGGPEAAPKYRAPAMLRSGVLERVT